jgi:AbrB family looped-hinge helix DNA binding protein
MKATVTSKGQITIPLSIRRHLKLRPGSILDFDEQAPFLVARRAVDTKKMRSVIGCARTALKGKSAAQWLDETRGKVELP